MSWELLRVLATLCAREKIVLRVIPEGLLLTATRPETKKLRPGLTMLVSFTALEGSTVGAEALVQLNIWDMNEILDKGVRDANRSR